MENNKLYNFSGEISNLVTKYAIEKYKPTVFVGSETVNSALRKIARSRRITKFGFRTFIRMVKLTQKYFVRF